MILLTNLLIITLKSFIIINIEVKSLITKLSTRRRFTIKINI